MQDYVPMCIYGVLGLPLFLVEKEAFNLSYNDFNLLITNNGKNKLHGLLLKFDNFSVIVTTISLIYLLWYFTEKAPLKKFFNLEYGVSRYIIYVSILLYFGVSLIRLLTFYISKIKINLYMILFMISLGPLLQFITFCSIEDFDDFDKVAIFCSIFIFFQHFFMDFIVWSGFI